MGPLDHMAARAAQSLPPTLQSLRRSEALPRRSFPRGQTLATSVVSFSHTEFKWAEKGAGSGRGGQWRRLSDRRCTPGTAVWADGHTGAGKKRETRTTLSDDHARATRREGRVRQLIELRAQRSLGPGAA